MNYDEIKEIVDIIKKKIKGLEITGSLKRKEQEIHDIDFLTLRNLKDVIDDFKKHFNISKISGKDKYKKFILNLDNIEIPIDIWKAENPENLLFLHILRDLDKGHVIGLHNKAKKKGYKLTQNGLYDENDNKIFIASKSDLMKKI